MESPQIRPGRVETSATPHRFLAFFPNSAQGNLAIQVLVGLGVPSDRLGVTLPDSLERGQGMLLSVGCLDSTQLDRAESFCRELGATVRRTHPTA